MHATTIFLSGAGTSGTTAGQSWSVDADNGDSGQDDWGMPGVGAGWETWTNISVNYITLTFTLPDGITIDPSSVALVNETTSVVWSPTVSSNDLSVTFYGNTDDLANGDSFFLNVGFADTYTPGDDVSTGGLAFSGLAGTTPEPASLAMLAVGLGAIGLLARRKRSNTSRETIISPSQS